MFFQRPADAATFSAEKMTKATLVQGEFLFAGLNALEAGQEHALHAHADQEKLYLVLEGSAEVKIGEQSEVVSTGGMGYAAAGVPHSIRNPGPERLVVMVVMSPPPRK
jgi:mannose-6-phosphate isomerase-like protein (cupin superfamily)